MRRHSQTQGLTLYTASRLIGRVTSCINTRITSNKLYVTTFVRATIRMVLDQYFVTQGRPCMPSARRLVAQISITWPVSESCTILYYRRTRAGCHVRIRRERLAERVRLDYNAPRAGLFGQITRIQSHFRLPRQVRPLTRVLIDCIKHQPSSPKEHDDMLPPSIYLINAEHSQTTRYATTAG